MHTTDPSDQYRDLAPARVSRGAAAGRILSPSEERLLELEAEAGIAKPAKINLQHAFGAFLLVYGSPLLSSLLPLADLPVHGLLLRSPHQRR